MIDNNITLADLIIEPAESHFIEKISDILDIDYFNINLYIKKPINISNQLIYGIYTKYINKLDIKQKYKNILLESLNVNGYGTSFIISSKEFYKNKNFTKKQIKQLDKLLDT